MKKFLSVLLIVCTVICAFSACSKPESSGDTTASASTQQTSAKEHDHSHIDAKNAKITDMQAIDIVKKHSKDKLGLKDEVDKYRWLVSTSGININDTDCFEVNACTIDDKDKENPVVDTKAVYYVSFDGKKVMMKDSKQSKIVEIK